MLKLKELKRVRTGVGYDNTRLGVEIMAVLEIEKYRQKNSDDVLKVMLKSTKLFPKGAYFYADTSDEELVRQYTWCLNSQKQPYIRANGYDYRGTQKKLFHQEKAFNILNYYPDYINHIDMVEFDNVNMNLDVVTKQQNQWYVQSKGYAIDGRSFVPKITVNSQQVYTKYVHSEVEACQVAYQLEIAYEDYRYDFLRDRRKDIDLLDLERTGKISEEEAVYRHVLRHAADNAWYVYRYNLFDYFNEYHVPIPSYSIDFDGYMVHPITGQRLCPL